MKKIEYRKKIIFISLIMILIGTVSIIYSFIKFPNPPDTRDWNYIQVRDFDYLETLWENNTLMNTNNLQDATESLGEQIIKELNIPITADPLNAEQSIFVKTIFRQPPRI